MFRPKTLLKVVSILFIIGGAFGLLGTTLSYVMLPKISDLPGMDVSMLKSVLTPLNLIISIVSSAAMITAGVFGFSGKSIKAATGAAGIYTIFLIISLARTFMNGTFTFLVVIDFIIPILYWWGLYQSKE